MTTLLSPKETEILKLVAEGAANKNIAQSFKNKEQTIKNHMITIMTKLNANNRTHAVALAMRQGWI